MPALLRPVLCLSLLGVAACDEIAVANDPVALAELRGNKSCIAAVKKQTGESAVTANTTFPVVETNQFVIDVAGVPTWVCYTDDNGRAQELTKVRTG
jgi:hypothetical protein